MTHNDDDDVLEQERRHTIQTNFRHQCPIQIINQHNIEIMSIECPEEEIPGTNVVRRYIVNPPVPERGCFICFCYLLYSCFCPHKNIYI